MKWVSWYHYLEMTVLADAKIQTPLANWIIDSIKPSYDLALVKLGYSKADVSIMNCGVIRGGQVYQPGGY